MHGFFLLGADLVPLDFNTPIHTGGVADALVSEPGPDDASHSPAGNPAPLLAELGLPDHVAREIAAERSAPTAWA